MTKSFCFKDGTTLKDALGFVVQTQEIVKKLCKPFKREKDFYTLCTSAVYEESFADCADRCFEQVMLLNVKDANLMGQIVLERSRIHAVQKEIIRNLQLEAPEKAKRFERSILAVRTFEAMVLQDLLQVPSVCSVVESYSLKAKAKERKGLDAQLANDAEALLDIYMFFDKTYAREDKTEVFLGATSKNRAHVEQDAVCFLNTPLLNEKQTLFQRFMARIKKTFSKKAS